jgi:hypothetical protein
MKHLLPPLLALALVLGALALALLLGAAGPKSDTPSPPAQPIQPVIARCLIDPQTGAVYTANDSGGIDVLSLRSGRLLWSTTEATDPLAVYQGRLLAWVAEPGQPNRIRVVAIEIRPEWLREKGTRALTSDPIIFPEWVSVTPANGRSFLAEARPEGGDLLLRWKAKAWYAGGANLGPEVEERARKEASGVARINLASGQVALLGEEGTALRTVVSHRAFFVTHGVVAVEGDFEVCPSSLRVVDVTSGKLLWERPVASLRQPKPLP